MQLVIRPHLYQRMSPGPQGIQQVSWGQKLPSHGLSGPQEIFLQLGSWVAEGGGKKIELGSLVKRTEGKCAHRGKTGAEMGQL